MMAGLVAEFVVTVICMGACVWLGYRLGFRKGRDQRLAELRKNVRQRAARAQAQADVLDAAARPRSRAARIKGTSRRADQPGPED